MKYSMTIGVLICAAVMAMSGSAQALSLNLRNVTLPSASVQSAPQPSNNTTINTCTLLPFMPICQVNPTPPPSSNPLTVYVERIAISVPGAGGSSGLGTSMSGAEAGINNMTLPPADGCNGAGRPSGGGAAGCWFDVRAKQVGADPDLLAAVMALIGMVDIVQCKVKLDGMKLQGATVNGQPVQAGMTFTVPFGFCNTLKNTYAGQQYVQAKVNLALQNKQIAPMNPNTTP